MKRSILSVMGAALLISCVFGCGDPLAEDYAKLNETNMQKMAGFYSMYHSLNDHKGPKDEAEFKAFLNSPDRAPNFKVMGVDPATIDDIFVGRDGKPYKIRYGIAGSPGGSDKPVVFEVDGLDGIRQVGFTSRMVREPKNDAEYDEWMEGNFEAPDRNEGRR